MIETSHGVAPDDIERPAHGATDPRIFGSDIIAEAIRTLDIPYILLNPGASFRGLHDSLVNHLGNRAPQMLLCLHEEHAIAICHGWAKVTGQPLAAALHSNVGLMHASMAIFNAWCDRMPVVIFGATGPMDATRRRPWIEWIHTTQDQASLVRDYIKWDAQPTSPGAAREAIVRAGWLARTAPMGPVYITLDAGLQEAEVREPLPPLDAARHRPVVTAAADPALLDVVADLLDKAERPVILVGRCSRSQLDWDRRLALAERLGARVATDLKLGAAFPTDHPLHIGHPTALTSGDIAAALAEADVVLSLDPTDLAGMLAVTPGGAAQARIIQVSMDYQLHNGWGMEHQGHPMVDVFLPALPDTVVAALLERLGKAAPTPAAAVRGGELPTPAVLDTSALTRALRSATSGHAVSLLRLPLSWNGADWPFRGPLDYFGQDGGGGIGSGPGMAVGSALALRGSGRLPVAVLGDGDFLMGCTAIWTAVHYRIPLLVVIANNSSFYNDEVHQERVATRRGRPVENKWIGQRIDDPAPDLAKLAESQGATGFGPVTDHDTLALALAKAVKVVAEGGVAVVDVRVLPGYSPAMASAMKS